MRSNRSSTTAAAVAFYRGLETVCGHPAPLFEDRAAEHLLGGALGVSLRLLERGGRHAPGLRRGVQTVLAPLSHHIALRTAAIDAALVEAVEGGVDQVVIVGAGLDARAWRMAALASVDVIEVDHPATQARKRARMGERAPRARAVRWAAVDFERASLADGLAETGHDPSRPTFWIWEGVTPYLPPAATEATVAVIGAASAAGSRVIVSYARPGLVTLPPRVGAALRPAIDAVFGVIGEPLRGAMTTEQFGGIWEAAGFLVREEHGSGTWAHRFGRPVPRLRVMERLLVAERVGRGGDTAPAHELPEAGTRRGRGGKRPKRM